MALSTSALFFARANNRLSASDCVDWAVAMLEQGRDSKSLRILAGLDASSVFEAEDFFQRAVRELQIKEPDASTATRAYACELAQRLAAGTLDPTESVHRLYEICVAADYPSELMVWYELDDAVADVTAGHYPWAYQTLTRENLPEVVRKEAQIFIDTCCRESVI